MVFLVAQILEGVAYEVSLNLHRQRDYTTRLVLILMSTVAKIASRCQDLIPRALLCLNKIVQLGHVSGTVLSRSKDVVRIVQILQINKNIPESMYLRVAKIGNFLHCKGALKILLDRCYTYVCRP